MFDRDKFIQKFPKILLYFYWFILFILVLFSSSEDAPLGSTALNVIESFEKYMPQGVFLLFVFLIFVLGGGWIVEKIGIYIRHIQTEIDKKENK